MKKRQIPKTVGGRRRFQLRYPRAVDQLHGLKQMDDLLEMPGQASAEKPGSGSRK